MNCHGCCRLPEAFRVVTQRLFYALSYFVDNEGFAYVNRSSVL